MRDFDFLIGEWHAHHRRLKERVADNHEWAEFDGTSSMCKLMGDWANLDDNVLNVPGGAYLAVSLRSYDPKTGQSAIWWLDGRNPFGDLDPPVKGRFENGIAPFMPTTRSWESRSACGSSGRTSRARPPAGSSLFHSMVERRGKRIGTRISSGRIDFLWNGGRLHRTVCAVPRVSLPRAVRPAR